jgi:hypothetical protein
LDVEKYGVIEEQTKLHNEEIHNVYCLHHVEITQEDEMIIACSMHGEIKNFNWKSSSVQSTSQMVL